MRNRLTRQRQRALRVVLPRALTRLPGHSKRHRPRPRGGGGGGTRRPERAGAARWRWGAGALGQARRATYPRRPVRLGRVVFRAGAPPRARRGVCHARRAPRRRSPPIQPVRAARLDPLPPGAAAFQPDGRRVAARAAGASLALVARAPLPLLRLLVPLPLRLLVPLLPLRVRGRWRVSGLPGARRGAREARGPRGAGCARLLPHGLAPTRACPSTSSSGDCAQSAAVRGGGAQHATCAQ